MPADLNRLTDGWLELESDPGLFTLLLEDFGVRGVQVEEIYDLQKAIEGPVYGFIFLFKWIEERRSRRKVVVAEESFVEDEEIVNSIFFAQQMVPNSCATHALLSVLLNCPKIYLGPTLARLKEHTANMSPENKGYAIGNTPELARAHNSHAKPEPRHLHEKSHGMPTGRTVETFHFVSYVPIGGRLFELDGLKPFPIDHGPCAEEDWTDKFRHVMTERLGIATGGEPYHDVRFNLMAVVPDRRIAYEQKLRTLKTNRQIVLEALQQLVKLTHPELTSDDHAVYAAAVNQKSSKGDRDDLSQQGGAAKQKATSGTNPGGASPYPKLPPALDSHNYAKSPLMEGLTSDASGGQPHYEEYSGSDYSDDDRSSASVRRSSEIISEDSHSNADSQCSLKSESNSGSDSLSTKEDASKPSLTPLTINTSSDLMKPLSIQTKFQPSPTPSASSTDTSSEAGSAFNSPVRSAPYNFVQGSPNSSGKMGKQQEAALLDDVHNIKKFVVIRVTSGSDSMNINSDTNFDCQQGEVSHEVCLDNKNSEHSGNKRTSKQSEEPPAKRFRMDDDKSGDSQGSILSCDVSKCEKDSEKSGKNSSSNNSSDNSETDQKSVQNKDSSSKHPKLIEPHRFAPKDLLALLKTVENEISICEANLHDEIEKRKKYKIDDCRRTHNYDQFICTFLSMLAEQGKLADLVEQQLIAQRRRGVKVGRLHKPKKTDKRRRSRPKKKK